MHRPIQRFVCAGFLAGLSTATTAHAQDYLGQASDSLSSASSYAGTVSVNAAAEASGKRGGPNFRGTGFRESYVREQCAGLARDRARLGSGHRRVVRWSRICRSARL
ncbi:hypothetical protein RZN05_12560 [Sphingomonas sp. HF-S4]|uniref:Uncharacterized protein n=1 Tax=Sphingomonas agrestis TaxID=3080540 RepID=A0ABU3Y8Y4_9SPHN|nr:hypothetical protein [Sphingomonas sp. HF-S4]MDV3457819.1 hypothetical protein [Sphingomonas sp. HF-S4]